MPDKYALCLGFSDQYSGRGLVRLPFAYKNVRDLSSELESKGYKVFPTIPEKDATKAVIKALLLEKISFLKPDDWLLFYYVGHGDITLNANSINNVTTYLITSFRDFDISLGFLNFFTDDDYAEVTDAFNRQAPDGHLITILDCCYAFGLVDAFSRQTQFHTIIAAATYDRKAFFDTNSFFFQGLSTLWDKSLLKITTDISKVVKSLYDKSRCQTQLAINFEKTSL
jgi:hypothetical protein